MHDVAPALAAKYPDGQVVHAVASGLLEYEPGSHSAHTRSLVLVPGVAMNEPAVQSV